VWKESLTVALRANLRSPCPSPGIPHPELQKLDVTSVTGGQGHIAIGDAEGCITLCDRKFTLNKFQAFERSVTKLHQLHQQNILVSIGDDMSATAVLKVRDMDKPDSETKGLTPEPQTTNPKPQTLHPNP
jgi:hypothetical protein